MPAGTQLVQFRGGELLPALAARASEEAALGMVARRDLGRYYAAIRQALESVDLTRAEACAVCEALNGVGLLDVGAPRYAWAEIADARGLGEKWGVDQDALVARVRDLDHVQTLALVDAAEQFWIRSAEPTDDALRAVGLLR